MRYNLIFILQQTIVEDAARRQQKCILYANKCVKNTRKTTENRQIEEQKREEAENCSSSSTKETKQI